MAYVSSVANRINKHSIASKVKNDQVDVFLGMLLFLVFFWMKYLNNFGFNPNKYKIFFFLFQKETILFANICELWRVCWRTRHILFESYWRHLEKFEQRKKRILDITERYLISSKSTFDAHWCHIIDDG